MMGKEKDTTSIKLRYADMLVSIQANLISGKWGWLQMKPIVAWDLGQAESGHLG